MPQEMIMEIEAGGSSMFAEKNQIPNAIHNLDVDLAVHHLAQTLLSGDDHASNIRHVMFSTRNGVEGSEVYEKIRDVFQNKHNLLRFQEIFHQLLCIDKSSFPDLRKVIPPRHAQEIVMVFITSESTKQANDELTLAMDLQIRTEDHLLPWEVFCQNANCHLVFSFGAIQRIAVQIVEECGGHLFALVLVAKSLKNVEDVELWELALNKLRQSDPSCDIDIKNGKLYYESMHHWVSYRLIDAKEAAHNLRELVQRSILLQLQGFQGKYIQLPEETYAILHSLNTLNPVFLKLSGLPLSPKCLELKVLILQGNADLTRIPPMFFCQIPLLWILDLLYTRVRELPNSFFELEQLKELYLKGCKNFMKLPPEIGRVKKLEKLDLDGTQIIHMPEEVQELTNLQSLTLCFFEYCGKKNKNMMNLEQLQVCILAECKEMQTIADGRYSKSKDILPHLLFLSVSYMKNLRSIWEGAVHSCHSFGMLKSLELQHCPNLVTIFISDFVGNLSLLEELMVKDCPKVTTLISHESSSISFLANIFLAKLKRATLLHLPELINISNGLRIGPSLEEIGIYDCPKLQSFSEVEISSQELQYIPPTSV
ncbi:disease resistance protein RPS2-like [Senna tora]|uniref:Disease resistance protein RPS2-like n=1 Tax=Senna tora TaxID=362788 RepID=A0A834XE66_9FABA|nr:disease resistance protein RPS2-like [Senna tora]